MNNKSGNLVIVNSCDYKLFKTLIANVTWKKLSFSRLWSHLFERQLL